MAGMEPLAETEGVVVTVAELLTELAAVVGVAAVELLVRGGARTELLPELTVLEGAMRGAPVCPAETTGDCMLARSDMEPKVTLEFNLRRGDTGGKGGALMSNTYVSAEHLPPGHCMRSVMLARAEASRAMREDLDSLESSCRLQR